MSEKCQKSSVRLWKIKYSTDKSKPEVIPGRRVTDPYLDVDGWAAEENRTS